MQDRGTICEANVWHGEVDPRVSAINPNKLNFCGDFVCIVSFEALLLLDGSR